MGGELPQFSPKIEEALEQALEDAIELNAREEKASKQAGIYPEPLDCGGPRYRSPDIWCADWRKRLPIGHPSRPTDDSEFIGHNDPAYISVIEMMVEYEALRDRRTK